MEILADYHTHTLYSHGKGTIEDNVKVAISKGIKTIGISDHGYKNIAYGVKIDDFKKMREEVDILNEKYKDQIKILLGLFLDKYKSKRVGVYKKCPSILALIYNY